VIDEPGHSTGHLAVSFEEETTMLKTISAALLAVSVIAAPALAAGARTAHAPAIKIVQAKPGVLNANARMGGHHVKHSRHHRAHKQAGVSHHVAKVTIKQVKPVAKRG
jgi:hypothetical protein